MKNFKRVGYIARIQPAHRGHIETIKRGLEVADEVRVLIGSAYQSRNIRNPFTFDERMEMLRRCFNDEDNKRITIVPLPDSTYNMEQWISRVQLLLELNVQGSTVDRVATDIALIGHKKDHTSFYLEYFPQYNFVEMENIDGLHSTDIREILFSQDVKFAKLLTATENLSLPSGVKHFLRKFFDTETYQMLRDEWTWNEDYKKRWSVAPYDVTFVTADNVVICAGHILLIKRRAAPGKGLWALPGGYINAKDETIANSAYRELMEETKINVPPAILRSFYKNENREVFDDPNRSARGRVITHAYKVHLPPQKIATGYGLPKVKGSDDAEKAKWVPLNQFQEMESMMFEDHWHIAQYWINQV